MDKRSRKRCLLLGDLTEMLVDKQRHYDSLGSQLAAKKMANSKQAFLFLQALSCCVQIFPVEFLGGYLAQSMR